MKLTKNCTIEERRIEKGGEDRVIERVNLIKVQYIQIYEYYSETSLYN
jgi:hypothetical protein